MSNTRIACIGGFAMAAVVATLGEGHIAAASVEAALLVIASLAVGAAFAVALCGK